MGMIVSILVFVLINGAIFHYITSSKKWEKPSLENPGQHCYFSGSEMFIFCTLATSLIAAPPMGQWVMRLFFWLAIAIFGFIIKRVPLYPSKALFLYSLLWAWFLFSALNSPVPIWGFRVLAKFSLPFIILLWIPSVIKSGDLVLYCLRTFCNVLLIYFCYRLLAFCGLGGVLAFLGNIWWWMPAIIDSLCIFIPMIIVTAVLLRSKKYLWLIIGCVALPLGDYVVRTGLIAMWISFTAMIIFHYRFKSIPLIFASTFGGLIFIFSNSHFYSKMFHDDTISIDSLENFDISMVNTNGRSEMWQYLLSKFYEPTPLTGHGLGSTQELLYQGELFGGLNAAHCDYIQILCDSGQIGLILFAAVIILLVVDCYKIYNKESFSTYCRYSAFIAGTGMCGIAGAMMTDNVVNYSMVTLIFPFTFYAFALGLRNLSPLSGHTINTTKQGSVS